MVCPYLSDGLEMVYSLVPQLKDSCSDFDTFIMDLISEVSESPCNAFTIVEQATQNCTDNTCYMVQEVIFQFQFNRHMFLQERVCHQNVSAYLATVQNVTFHEI